MHDFYEPWIACNVATGNAVSQIPVLMDVVTVGIIIAVNLERLALFKVTMVTS